MQRACTYVNVQRCAKVLSTESKVGFENDESFSFFFFFFLTTYPHILKCSEHNAELRDVQGSQQLLQNSLFFF